MIKEVLQWNNERGLLNGNFNKDLEFNLLLEEVLELKINDKAMIKHIISYVNEKIDCVLKEYKQVSNKDIADAFIDIKVIANGGHGKLIKHINKDYSIDDIEKIIKAGEYEVIQANNKKPKEKDSNGKIIKGDDFIEPIIPLTLEELKNETNSKCRS